MRKRNTRSRDRDNEPQQSSKETRQTRQTTTSGTKPNDGNQMACNDDDDGEQEYIVEMLCDKHVDSEGMAKYSVEWENYSRTENTWEPVDNIHRRRIHRKP